MSATFTRAHAEQLHQLRQWARAKGREMAGKPARNESFGAFPKPKSQADADWYAQVLASKHPIAIPNASLSQAEQSKPRSG